MPAEQTIYRRNKEPPVDEDRTRFSFYFLLFFLRPCDDDGGRWNSSRRANGDRVLIQTDGVMATYVRPDRSTFFLFIHFFLNLVIRFSSPFTLPRKEVR